MHNPAPDPQTEPRPDEPDTTMPDPPVPPDVDVVPVQEPPKPGRAPGERRPLIA